MTDRPDQPEAGQNTTVDGAALGTTEEPADVPLPADLAAVMDNIRGRAEDDLSELRDSLREYGWVVQFPALRDERGMVLVGHRRLRAAAELGIEPVYCDVVLGQGNDADAERLKIALVSNIGAAPLNPKRRQRIAARLRELGWTQRKIGEALRVSTMQVSRDLEAGHLTSSEMSVKESGTTPQHHDRLGRKRSTGRPRKPKREAAEPRTSSTAEIAAKVPDETVRIGEQPEPTIVIELLGHPHGKGRPRRARLATGKIITHPDPKTAEYEANLRLAGQQAMAGRPPLDGPLLVVLEAFFPIPSSKSKKFQRDALAGIVRPTIKPDWNNIGGVTDGLNNVAWDDDKQIVQGTVFKWYGDRPRLVIRIWPVPTVESRTEARITDSAPAPVKLIKRPRA